MGNPEIKDLFYKTRFIGGLNLLGVVLYLPVGLLLALLRVFISLQAYLLALLLLIPELSFVRKYILRVMSLALGIFVIEENRSQRDKNIRVLISNHVSILDHVPVHLLTGCFSPSKWDVWPLCLKVFEGSQDKHMFAASLRSHLSKCSHPMLLHPEEAVTNGKVGLLKYLPVVQRQEGETDEEMADRIAQTIGKETGLVNTKFSAKDKHDFEKRYLMELNRRSASHLSQPSPRVSYELQRMASQVAEVLPYVPFDAIIRDLSRTRSVDLTISNILEGTVRFTPVPPEQRASTSAANRTNVSALSSSDASCSFPRSAQDRMMSFVERKARLIEEARRRYMEKHGLVDKQ